MCTKGGYHMLPRQLRCTKGGCHVRPWRLRCMRCPLLPVSPCIGLFRSSAAQVRGLPQCGRNPWKEAVGASRIPGRSALKSMGPPAGRLARAFVDGYNCMNEEELRRVCGVAL